MSTNVSGGQVRPISITVIEDSGFTILARVLDYDASAIQQADLTAVSYKVFDLDSATPNTAIQSGSLTIANVIFDTLQTDARWTLDSTGYNFRWTVPANHVPTGDNEYQIEIKFDPASGEDFHLPPILVHTEALRGS